AKRLEKGRFAAPWERGDGDALTWPTSELALFLEGCKRVGKVPLSPPPFVMSNPRDEQDAGVRESGRDAAERDDRPRGAAQSSCDPRPRERAAHPGKPEAAEGEPEAQGRREPAAAHGGARASARGDAPRQVRRLEREASVAGAAQ